MGHRVDPEQFFEEFVKAINALEDAVILVEGPRDKRALEALGIKQPIIWTRGARLQALIEALSEYVEEVVILFDLDEEGERLAREARELCELYGLKRNLEFRRLLLGLGIIHVEDLMSLRASLSRLDTARRSRRRALSRR